VQHAVGAHLPAGLSQQPRRVDDVVGIRRQRRRAQEPDRCPTCRVGCTVVDGVVDARPIHRFGDRAPDAHVGKERLGRIEPEMPPRRDQTLVHDDAVYGRQAVHVVLVHGRVDVDLVRLELREEGVDVGNDLPVHFAQFRRSAEVERIGNERELAAVVPRLEQIRAAGDRRGVERAVLMFGNPASRCAGSGGYADPPIASKPSSDELGCLR